MLRVTPAQYQLLIAKPEKRLRGAPRVKKRREDLPENQVERQITDFLKCMGWTVTKQHAGISYRRNSDQVAFSQVKGTADWSAERPIIPQGMRPTRDTCFALERFYLEVKAPGKKPQAHQLFWLDQRQLTGTTATWADSIQGFQKWYWKRYGIRAGDPPRSR
jgi:hypothetical protein